MKYIYTILSVFLFITISGCNSSNKAVKLSIRKCVNHSINSYLGNIYDEINIDFYELMDEVEKRLIRDGVIKNISKSEYLKLLKNISKEKNMYKNTFINIYKFLEESKFEGNGYFLKSFVLKDCPYEVLIKEENDLTSPLRVQVEVSSQLEANGFDDIELIKYLIENVDDEYFEDPIYRSPITLLLYLNIKMQYKSQI